MENGDLTRLRDWLDAQCQARHERATRDLRREIGGVRDRARENTATLHEISRLLAQALGSGDREGEVGRMKTDIEAIKKGREEDQARMTRQEQLHYKILVTCFLGASAAAAALKGLEMLIG